MRARNLLIVLAATAAGCGRGGAPVSPPVGNGAPGALLAPAPPDDQSRRIVAAARAFLAGLTPGQRKAALFPFSDGAQRVKWSNFPTGFVPRSGVSWGTLNDPQRRALMLLLHVVLSAQGVRMVVEQMQADDILARNEPAMFGAGRYFVSNGRRVYIVEDEVRQAQALMRTLTPEQMRQAVRSTEKIDLVLGPGHDGQMLQPEGLAGSAMTPAQQAQFLRLIEARLDFLNADDVRPQVEAIRRTLGQTWFGWWGATAPLGAAYYRITGPRVLIEFSPQDLDGDATNHAHNMVRDPANEYGSAWTKLR